MEVMKSMEAGGGSTGSRWTLLVEVNGSLGKSWKCVEVFIGEYASSWQLPPKMFVEDSSVDGS